MQTGGKFSARCLFIFELLRGILAADFLPDFITISINGLIVTRARGTDTLLIIQHAYAFFIGKLLVLFSFFSTFNTLWQASIFSGDP